MIMLGVKCDSRQQISCIHLQLTGSVNLFDQSPAFGMKRHSGCLFELLGSLSGYNNNDK